MPGRIVALLEQDFNTTGHPAHIFGKSEHLPEVNFSIDGLEFPAVASWKFNENAAFGDCSFFSVSSKEH